jgi:hypothetical protein
MHKKCFFSCLGCLWLRMFWSVFGQISTQLECFVALSGLGNEIGTLIIILGFIFIHFAGKKYTNIHKKYSKGYFRLS